MWVGDTLVVGEPMAVWSCNLFGYDGDGKEGAQERSTKRLGLHVLSQRQGEISVTCVSMPCRPNSCCFRESAFPYLKQEDNMEKATCWLLEISLPFYYLSTKQVDLALGFPWPFS